VRPTGDTAGGRQQFVRYPGDAVLWIKLLQGPRNPSGASIAVINARKIS
jgi:hypothetical protein